jgi:hypothetical protein
MKRREPKPFWDRAWLDHEYSDLGRSATEIAADFGCHENNILYFLSKHRIPRRTISQTRAVKHWGSSGEANPMFGKTGVGNPNWRGGVTPERQSVYVSARWKSVAKQVRRRDGGICQRCGESGEHLHHLASFAIESGRYDPDNLVLLCRACHRFVHSRRNKNGEFLRREGTEC